MGEAKRKRGIAKAAAAEPVNVIQVELFHRGQEVGDAIAKVLAATNEAREKLALKPLTRSAFLGYVVVPAGLQAVLRDLATREADERLVKTPEEVAAESQPVGYTGRRS